MGVSVVNALSAKLEIEVKRNGKVYRMEYADGEKQTELTETGTVGRNNTGTAVKFWPNEKYFDSNKISVIKAETRLARQGGFMSGLENNLKGRANRRRVFLVLSGWPQGIFARSHRRY